LDKYVSTFKRYSERYKSGFDRTIRKEREALKQDILKYFGATEDDWEDSQWHPKHVIKGLKTLSSLVTLEPDEVEGMTLAAENHIPGEIRPCYLSLFHKTDGWTMTGRSEPRSSRAHAKAWG
jgi:lysine 2,3-aminomutase